MRFTLLKKNFKKAIIENDETIVSINQISYCTTE